VPAKEAHRTEFKQKLKLSSLHSHPHPHLQPPHRCMKEKEQIKPKSSHYKYTIFQKPWFKRAKIKNACCYEYKMIYNHLRD
jgi:hypothetical protein